MASILHVDTAFRFFTAGDFFPIMAGFRLRSASVPHERVQHVFHDACQLHDFPYPKIFRGTVVGIGIEKRHLEESAVFPQFIMNGKNHLF